MLIWSDTLFHKFNWLAIFVFSLGLAPYLDMFETYVFNDWKFALSVLILLAIDTITGLWKAIELKEVSSLRFRDVLKKLVLYFMLMIVGFTVSNYMVGNEKNVILGLFDNIIYAFIMITETLSILENMSMLGVPIPIWIKKRLMLFTEEGILDPLKKKEIEDKKKE